MSSTAPLDTFPPAIREAHARWLAHHDPAALDAVVLAVIAYHAPRRGAPAPATPPADSARLIADLGFDSLSLAETVFFVEDLYQVALSNADLAAITTVADLRAFVRTKIAGS